MKSKLVFLLGLLFLFVSCSKSDVSEQPSNGITIAPGLDTPVFEQKTSVKSVVFTTTGEWKASIINEKADEWVSISPTSGAKGENSLFITTTDNNGSEDRFATIEIVCGSSKRQIKVTQKQKDALTVTSSKFEVDAKGGLITIEVKSNIDYAVSIDDKCVSWVDKLQTRAMSTTTCQLSIAENTDLEKREGKVTISSGNLSENIYIFQSGAAPSIVLTKNEYIIPSSGDTITIDVSSNVLATCVLPSGISWIKEIKTRAMSTNSFYFVISNNPELNNREAEIQFVNIENGLSESVKIIQMQKDELIVAKSQYEISDKGGTIIIGLGHNIDYDIEIEGSEWIQNVTTRAFVQDNLSFSIAPNFAYEIREGTITFSSKDKSKTQVVRIIQGQVNAIILDEKNKTILSDGGAFSVNVIHNVDITVLPLTSWLHQVQTRSLNLSTFNFIADANTMTDYRIGKILFLDNKTGVSDTLTVTQLQKDAIVAAKEKYAIARKGDTISIAVGHNVDYTTSTNVSWISQISTRAFTIDNLTFIVAANNTGQDRTGLITFTSRDGIIKQEVKVEQTYTDVIDLSSKGTANCYIVNKEGTYKFNASVKGNSTESVGTPAKAEVLWETFGTDVKPHVGDIIPSVSYSNKYITFTTPSTLVNGNAVIAVKDASGTILWSWHIWVCKDFDPDATAHTYANGAGVMMDRNLGATSCTPGDVHALGLLYQWGRKDPFMGCSGILNQNKEAAFTATWSLKSNGASITYSIQNPTDFIACSSSTNYDWCTDLAPNKRWGQTKSIYDPSPVGWKVTDENFWLTAFGSSSTLRSNYDDSNNSGFLLPASISGTPAWYPFFNIRGCWGGGLDGNGILITTSYLSTRNLAPIVFEFQDDLKIHYYNGVGSLAYAAGIRCQKE